MTSWDPRQLGEQAGRTFVITGANSGIGYWAALELARAGAHVVMACRDRSRGEAARRRLLEAVPGASVEVGTLDLASLASVREFAAEQVRNAVDLLINNAGVMAPKLRRETADGMELQFGTNVVGHFALTGLLLPAIERAAEGPGCLGWSRWRPSRTRRGGFGSTIYSRSGGILRWARTSNRSWRI